MTNRKWRLIPGTQLSVADGGAMAGPAKFARSRPATDVDEALRDSQPFHHSRSDGGPAQPGQVVPPTPVEAAVAPLSRSLEGWMPAVALADGRLAVRLEHLPGFPDALLLWPVVELPDGALAVLVHDLWRGLVK